MRNGAKTVDYVQLRAFSVPGLPRVLLIYERGSDEVLMRIDKEDKLHSLTIKDHETRLVAILPFRPIIEYKVGRIANEEAGIKLGLRC